MDHEISSDDFVRYVDVGKEYFKKRQLRQEANGLLLWGLAVAATMFGHLFGWNFGLVAGGFWGMVIATLLVALMYVCLVFSIAELSAALPHTGGFYSFTRYAFGPLGGFICGTAQAIQYLLMPAVIVGWLADYLSPFWPSIPLELWWLVLYTIFVLINILSTRLTLLMTFLLALLAISFLSFFYVSVWITGAFDLEGLFTLLPRQNQSALLPKGWTGIFAALPFAIWFYLPLDLISLLAEETDDAQSRVPKALKWSLPILLPLSFLTLVATSSLSGGVALIGISQTPLLDGLQPILDEISPVVGVMPILVGGSLLLAFCAALSITLAYSRVLFALSRAGYFPKQLSLTGRYQTPERALIWGAVVGLLSLYLLRESNLSGPTLANMVLFAAMLSYICVMASYLKLKQKEDLPRPYSSPLGSRGAAYALLGAIITLVASFLNPDIRSGAYGLTLFLLVAIFYFLFISSQQLIAQAPEEKLAPNYESDTTARGIANKILVVLLSVAATYAFIRFGLATFTSPCPPDCMGAYLIREKLSGADFRKTNFVFARMREVDLSGADLREADLSGAYLTGANLANANLSRAKLIGANLTDADLGGVILSHADMSGANLNRANLTNVNLTTTRLRGVQLEGAYLTGANLSGLDMAGARLTSAIMKEANLSQSNLAGATLSFADLSGADLSGSTLTGAWLNESNLTDASLEGADLSGARLIGANLTSANLSASQLVGSTLIGATFFGSNLSSTNLERARWRISTFTEQELAQQVQLKPFHKQDADFSGVEFNSQTEWPSEEFTLGDRDAPRVQEEAENVIKVGLLYSLSGPLAVSELPVSKATLLAIDEINATGGVLGKQLIPIVQNGASTEEELAEKASFLLQEEQVAVVFGGSRLNRPLKMFEKMNSLLFYPFHYEGFERSPNVFYIGADPTQQIIPAARYLLTQNFETIILLGTDDSFSRTANLIVKAVLRDAPAESKMQVVGEVYVPLEQRDFSRIISQIKTAQPVAIFNSMAGQSNQAFFQQFKAARLTPQLARVMSVSVSESEVQQIGPNNIAGHLTVWSYYQTDNSLENNLFVQAVGRAYGPNQVTSDPIEAGYVAVYLWKEMVEQAGELSIDALRAVAASSEIRYLAPSGLVRIDGETQSTYLKARVGIVREDGLIEEIVSTALKPPDPFLSQYDWGAELSRAIQNLKSQEQSK